MRLFLMNQRILKCVFEIDYSEIRNIINKYFGSLYYENLDEIEEFLNVYYLLKLKGDDINNLNVFIVNNKIEIIIKNF